MKNLFILTSALNTKFGVHNNEQRLQQTLDSIASIKKYAPGADILVVEMGGFPPSPDQIAMIKYDCNYYYNFSEDDSVQGIFHSTDNWDIVKNTTEVMVFGNLLKQLVAEDIVSKYDRIFKMSGRYQLNQHFDPTYYESVPDRIVVLQRKSSQFPPQITGNRLFQYMSRLWSWPAADTDKILRAYEQGFLDMAQQIAQGGYFDIEHMLFDYLPAEQVTEIPRVGVQGLLGPNGTAIED
jgi:hypothetical protein